MAASMGLGYLSDPEDERDLKWRESVQPEKLDIPASFLYDEALCGNVLDQKATSECVAFSGTSQKLWAENKQHGHFYNFDPDWLYKQCKAIDGSPHADGTFIRIALQVMQTTGHLAHAGNTLTQDCYFKIDNYVRLTTLQDIKEALATLGPVWFGIQVDNGIFSPTNGVVAEPTGQTVGGHAMLIVGYDDTKVCLGSTGAFKIKNSWGSSYAEGGYMWMPYTWFAKYSDWDAWKTVDDEDLNTFPVVVVPTPVPMPVVAPTALKHCSCKCTVCKNCVGYTKKTANKIINVINALFKRKSN